MFFCLPRPKKDYHSANSLRYGSIMESTSVGELASTATVTLRWSSAFEQVHLQSSDLPFLLTRCRSWQTKITMVRTSRVWFWTLSSTGFCLSWIQLDSLGTLGVEAEWWSCPFWRWPSLFKLPGFMTEFVTPIAAAPTSPKAVADLWAVIVIECDWSIVYSDLVMQIDADWRR